MSSTPTVLYRTTDWTTEVQLRSDFVKRSRALRYAPAFLSALADAALARWMVRQAPHALHRNDNLITRELSTISSTRSKRTRAALVSISA